MLRRKATAITVTSEDIATFDDERTRRYQEENHQVASPREDMKKAAVDPNDELKPLPGDKARIVRTGLTRDERIGLGR